MFSTPKLILLLAASAFLSLLGMSACGGEEFARKAADSEGGSDGITIPPPGSGGSGNSGPSGSGGAGMNSTQACAGPEDCDDGMPCTVDLCNANGTCGTSPLCPGSEKCCGSDCAECCGNEDCDDGVSCTADTCFAGQCMFVPNDMLCDSTTEYCSAKDGCRVKQVCGLQNELPENECDDGSACTTDACVNNFCRHDYCINEMLCCAGGCEAECCVDSQCNTTDPCTVGKCDAGKCSLVLLCAGGEQCCPSADGTSASCGACCSAEDCNDYVACTSDQCGGGRCSNTPDDRDCESGYFCDPEAGCKKADDCSSADDCVPGPCQSNPRCDDGLCKFDGCSDGTKCCLDSARCALCCGDDECDDNISCTVDACGPEGCTHTPKDSLCRAAGQRCDPHLGCIDCVDHGDCADDLPCTEDVCLDFACYHNVTCAKGSFCTTKGCSECTYDSDCQGGIVVSSAPEDAKCAKKACQDGQCVEVPDTCGSGETCCPPFGCVLQCGILPPDTM